jgi:hypothetical protein
MDALLELIVAKIPTDERLVKYQPTAEWLGESYPQGEAIYHWGTHVEIRPDTIQPWVLKFLPSGFVKDDLQWLQVAGEGLDLLELDVNEREVEWNGRRLCDLLRVILSQNNAWVLSFIWHYDRIDNTYRMNVDEAIEKLQSNLKWGTAREGFIVHS